MAIESDDLRSILRALRERESRESLLILGDAAIFVAPPQLEKLAAEVGYPLSFVPDELDPFTLGASLGFTRTETLDVNGKASLTVNLDEEVPLALIGAFDCLIDAGVLFWCFDPASALRNILKMVRAGGTIVHITAVSGHYGRGYYNIHPLLLEDFYLGNGCALGESSFRTKFRAHGLLARVTSRLRIANTVTRYREPGHVYLAESRLNRIGFGLRYRAPFEANLIPNNVLGVFVFQKNNGGEIVNPVRTSPFDELSPRPSARTPQSG